MRRGCGSAGDGAAGSISGEAAASTECRHSARPCASVVKAMPPPPYERIEHSGLIVRSLLRFSIGFGRGERGPRFGLAYSGLGRKFVTARFALRAVLMPVRAFKSTAGSPLVTPFLIRLRARTLGISRFAAVRVATHSKGVRCV
eukprot:1235407-Pleurochrysis_carterae.AAC.2